MCVAKLLFHNFRLYCIHNNALHTHCLIEWMILTAPRNKASTVRLLNWYCFLSLKTQYLNSCETEPRVLSVWRRIWQRWATTGMKFPFACLPFQTSLRFTIRKKMSSFEISSLYMHGEVGETTEIDIALKKNGNCYLLQFLSSYLLKKFYITESLFLFNAKFQSYLFLDTFANLRKATISFVMSVFPSDRMERLGSHWTDFY